jgi:hypothetical protein
MNGIDNIAGYTLTVGTADFVITDSIAQYDPIVDNLDDGDERNYKAQFIDASMSTDYETGRGTWNATAGTISRDTIKTSSNNGAIVNFGAGPKVVFIVSDYESLTDMNNMVDSAVGAGSLKMTTAERTNIAANVALLATRGDAFTYDIGTTASTIAEGDDLRFGSVDYGDLDPAATLDGTEIVAIDQGGDGVQTTVQDIAGNPLIAARGHARNYISGYTRFNRTLPLVSINTDNTLCGLENWLTNLSGAGTEVSQFAWLGVQAFYISTGTTSTGRCAIISTQYANIFDPSRSWETIVSLGVSAQPSVEAYTAQIGYIKGLPALATDGIYFQLSAASANWRAIVRDDGVETNTDTTVSGVGAHVGRIFYDADALATKFYINGALVATVPNATRVIDTGDSLQMAYSIIKSAGTTSTSIATQGHYYKNEEATLPAGW